MSIVEKAIEKLNKRPRTEPGQSPVVSGTEPAAPPRASSLRAEQPVAHVVAPVNRPSLRLDFDHLRAAGLLPPLSEERRLAGEFRQVKRPLVDFAFGSQADEQSTAGVIMIASAIPGDGKTFTAFNLALSLSLEQDASVLLVDADIPKPQISNLLGIHASLGLLDALRDPSIDTESIVYDTDRPNLQILAAGATSETATELLASRRMFELVAQLRSANRNRIVVFDSPPLLMTTESRELASAAGQVVLVVRAGVTPRQAVFDAIALLGEGKRVGVLLNQVDSTLGDSSYYGYGKYGGYGAATPEDG